jgi:sporulation protein YtfJ
MSEHPIEGLMETAMNSIKDMIDVNTIIGEPIETSNGMVIIPISKVSLGFAAGGSEFKGETVDEYKKKDREEEVQYRLPFGGGSGAGISINPVAFVIVQKDSIKVLPIEHNSAIERLIDYVPDLMEKADSFMDKTLENQDKSKDSKGSVKKSKIIKKIKTKPAMESEESEEIKENIEDSKPEQE